MSKKQQREPTDPLAEEPNRLKALEDEVLERARETARKIDNRLRELDRRLRTLVADKDADNPARKKPGDRQ